MASSALLRSVRRRADLPSASLLSACKSFTSNAGLPWTSSPSPFGQSLQRLSRVFSSKAAGNDLGTTRFRKHQRGRMKGISSQGNRISFGTYALQALELSWITARQIEAGRRAITRNARSGGKMWARVFADKPVTVRPTETRMGRGKGNPAYRVAVIKPGRILYEMGGVAESVARKAISIAASKMPVKTQFIILK